MASRDSWHMLFRQVQEIVGRMAREAMIKWDYQVKTHIHHHFTVYKMFSRAWEHLFLSTVDHSTLLLRTINGLKALHGLASAFSTLQLHLIDTAESSQSANCTGVWQVMDTKMDINCLTKHAATFSWFFSLARCSQWRKNCIDLHSCAHS